MQDIPQFLPWLDCRWVIDDMFAIMAQHMLWFKYTSKGGAFYKEGFRCVITTTDGMRDLETLKKAVASLN